MKELKKFEWNASEIEKVLIHSISADIVVDRNEEKKISLEVELSGLKKDVEEYEPKMKITEGKFEVDLFPPNGTLYFGFIRFGTLEVQKAYLKIPDDLSFRIETTSGDNVINDLSFNELRLSSVSGDFKMNTKEVKTLFVKTTSGDINIEKIPPKLDEMDLQSVSGDIKSKVAFFNRGSVKTTSGNMTFMNVDPKFEFLEVKTISGDFSIEFTSKPVVHVEIETISGDIESDANTVIGKISHVSFDVGEKPLSTLKFKSISGDATFKFGSKSEDANFEKIEDERLKIFEEILKSKRATKAEIKELMITIGYKDEEITKFLSDR